MLGTYLRGPKCLKQPSEACVQCSLDKCTGSFCADSATFSCVLELVHRITIHKAMEHALVSRMQCLSLKTDDSSADLVKMLPAVQLFREVCYKLENTFPRGDAGDSAFASYGASGWTTEDYAIKGFARKYVSKKFESRTSGVLMFLRTLNEEFMLDFDNAHIIDMGAGPGCGAVAAAKFLNEIRVDRTCSSCKATLLDPVSIWADTAVVLRTVGIQASFKESASLEMMVGEDLRDSLAESATPVVILISHVLQDFGGETADVEKLWVSLARVLHGRRAIVLVLERSPCEKLMPRAVPGGGNIFRFKSKEPMHSEDASYGAAIFLPANTAQKRPQHLHLPRTPTFQSPPTAPTCPNCGGLMEIRINKRGYNPGSRFYGCTNFPQCRGTRKA